MGRLLGLLLCAFLLLTVTSTFASEISDLSLGMRDFTQSQAHLNVSRTSPELTRISLAAPVVVMQDQMVNYQSYQAFGIAGESFVKDIGSPTVPQVTRFYRIPNTGSAEMVISDADYDLVENVNSLPVQPQEPAFGTVTRNEAVYSKDGWYPENVAVMSDPMIMRDFRVVTVTLYPVQVNPVTHQARIYRNLSVDVVANNRPGVNELLNPHRPSREWASMYRAMIPNLDDSALDDVTTGPGSMLILTSTNAIPRPFADSLFVWKTRQGFKVSVDARASWTSAAAITAIRNAYAAAPVDAPLEFVVLMGDPGAAWAIPIDNTDNSFDHNYARANTGDDIEDIAVGRLSGGDAATLATINAKIMGYERNPHMESSPGVADTMWFHKAFLYASVGRNCVDNALAMRWGRQQFINNTGVDSVDLATHPTDAVVESDVLPRLNAGVSFFIWRGSWIGGMSSSIASRLNSTWRLPVCMTVTCDAGDYNSSGINGPAEDFLCEGTAANPKGAVCGIGTSTSGTENGANIILASGLLYNITDLTVEHLGTAVAGAKAQLYYSFGPTWPDPEGYPGGIAAKFSRLFNLLGDPSLSMWTDVPKVLDVTHPNALNVGARSVDITVTRAADAIPVQDAVVCLWKRGSDSTWATGMTDEQGHITLPVNVNAAGDMYLTVTKRNHKPFLFTIPCGQVDAMPMYSSVVLDDDNSSGTHGNGDHVMNAGETIDLPVYIRNFGNAVTVTGIRAVLTSNNPRVTVSTDSASYANIAPGDSTLGSTPFRIVVAPDMQNHETVLLTLTINSSAPLAVGAIPLTCVAGEALYQRHNLSTVLNPGSTANLTVVVRNTGTVPMLGVTGHLTPLTPFVQADVGTASFGDIAAGALDSNSASPFTLTANTMTFRGLQAPMRLILTSAAGFADTVQFNVSVGTAQATDPTGPDAYGYYAYDNTDAAYDIHPTFAYVDISSSGTLLSAASQDPGDKQNLTPIMSNVVRLPFGFKFYGRVYDSLTVCSNGWCAFGNQSWYDGFRNFQIPAMRAADAMIAPYWDDLQTTGTGHGVWVKSDTTNHRYIIQWKATANQGAPNLDFEVLLYDTTYQPTFTGNGNVVVQYNHVVMNINPQFGDDAPGCTIGIQMPGNLVGLQYAYQNSYSPGAATVSDGRAILFTTDARMMFGQIQGTVRNAADNLPMAGVTVGVNGYAYHATTDAAGHYLIPDVLIGTYGMHTSFHRFNNDSVANVLVQLDSTATADFSVHHPEMTLSTDSLVDSISGSPAQMTFNIVNNGNGPLDYSIRTLFPGDNNPTPWDSVGNIQATQLTNNFQLWGCEFMGDYWYVTGADPGIGHSVIYKFGLDGALAATIPQPSSSLFGWFDMATDGHLIYGSDGHVIYGIDENGQVQDTIPSPLNPTRAIAYDSLTHHFWIADYTSDIYEIDRNGAIINQVPNTSQLTITGLAWNALDANGYKLYIFSQDGASQTRLTRMMTSAPYTKETVLDLPGQAGDRSGGCTITPAWNSTLMVFAAIMRGASGADHLEIYEMTFNTSWISATPAPWNVPGGGSGEVTVHFDPASLRDGSYRVDLHISSAVYDTTQILPVRLTVYRGPNSAQPHVTVMPAQYALHQNYPNPFNPTTNIRYELKTEGLTRLSVFNVLGEKVADLVNAKQPAGFYDISFDASALPSGVYFYRLTSGNFTQSAKMILMK
ncbi:MAG TPA: C25 family cysteine peptidase [bacterium]